MLQECPSPLPVVLNVSQKEPLGPLFLLPFLLLLNLALCARALSMPRQPLYIAH